QSSVQGVSRANNRGSVQETELKTGVTAGRAEDRGRCWQGRGQGSLLAGQRIGVAAGRAEDRGRCWQGRG
ncbi:unnamed protein product, partial [Staurois parvus]